MLGIFFLSFLLNASAYADSTPANVVPIEVDGSFNENNIPFVSVTVCLPGTTQCQTIPHILLDTGSTGLRIFSAGLNLKFTPEKNSSGDSIAECMSYAGGANFWGSVALADVGLGGEKAQSVPIQIVDNHFATTPSGCTTSANPDPSHVGSNGTLGVSPGLTDCRDSDSCPNASTTPYYACNGLNCLLDIPLVNQQIQNPISYLPHDNNGMLIRFPSVGPSGALAASGAMILGIGTQTNNQPSKGMTVLKTDFGGQFRVHFNGTYYTSRIDSGTQYLNLPDGSGVPNCTATGDTRSYLCPATQQIIQSTLLGYNTDSMAPFKFSIENADQMPAQDFAFSDVGEDMGGGAANLFLIGLPFFYGKTIAFGFDRASTPLGVGPFNAF